jgi:hypothetical protein
MTKPFGPILYACGQVNNAFHYTLLATTPQLELPGAPQVKWLAQHRDICFYAVDFSVPLTEAGQNIDYRAGTESFRFQAPPTSSQLRLAFVSCNGSEQDQPGAPALPAQNAMWQHLNERHTTAPFHLMLQGGDQIYADSLWRRIPTLTAWKEKSRREQFEAPFPPELAEEVRAHYFDCYLTHWSRPELRTALASIPQLMMWDDHDIFDGWGSWNDRYQNSPTYRGIFKAAREAFNLFQRGQKSSLTEAASWAVRLGEVGIIAPDLRTLRSRSEVLGDPGWRWLLQTLQQLDGCKELIVVSSVPLATAHFSALDPILTGLPSAVMKHIPHRWNPKQFADDIHDQWRVPAHRQEWRSVLTALLDFGQRNDARVTVLSGEIHLGARSTIRRDHESMVQYIASGIAHQPAHPLVTWACEWLSRGTQDLPGNLHVRMERFFNEHSRRRYLAARNWLEFEIRPHGIHTATWHAENHPPVVHQQSPRAR